MFVGWPDSDGQDSQVEIAARLHLANLHWAVSAMGVDGGGGPLLQDELTFWG